MPERYPPDDPREWAKQEGIYLEDLCFHAQQAVEKAVKALLIRLGMEFPYTNDVAFLLTLLAKAGQEIPNVYGRQRDAVGSRFSHDTRVWQNRSAMMNMKKR